MADIKKASKVPEAKKSVVNKIADLIKKYPIIGALNMENLPAAQLQRMKANLRDKVEMLMTKRRLMKLAIDQVKGDKKGIEKIEEHLKGMPALLFTNENPFTLFKILKKSKSKAPAKAGQTAPIDIIVKAGPTQFAPGPVIGELGALGLKTKVEDGKIAILEDAVVCKEGEEITANLAGMLVRLGIEPMQIGLDLVAVYEKGDIFTKSVLDIDEDKFMADLSQAATWAFNLSVDTAFITDVNKEMLIQKAYMDSKALAISENILADAVAGDILAKAEREMMSLKSSIPELPAAAEEKSAEPAKEEPKAEEKKEEPKAEEPKKEEKAEEKPAQIPEKIEEPKAEVVKVEEKPAEEAKPAEEPKKEEEKVEEEPKKEEKAPETKQEEPKAEESKPDVDKKVENIVEQAKIKAEGKNTAEKLVEEVAEEKKEEKKPAEEPKAEEKKEEEPKKEESDQKEVEDLTKELLKKGTLRK